MTKLNTDDHYWDRYQNFSIELDCPPGEPRPKHLIHGVIKGTGFKLDDFETANPFFGNQVWILKAEANKDDEFVKAKPIFFERINDLYNRGVIRYGSW